MPLFDLILKFILLFIFLCFSAFFSASETALFSLDSIKLKRLMQGGKNASFIFKLLENPMRCLSIILLGNTLVDVALSAFLTSFFIDLLGNKGISIAIGVTTLILLLFGEVTPKTIAIYNNERLARLCSPPLYFFGKLVEPFLFVSTTICDAVIAFFHLNLKKEPTLTEEEFMTVMEVSHRHGVVAKSEKELVASILELTTTTAQEVMTPRVDIKAVSIHWDRDRILAFARDVRRTKLPVYKNSFDDMIGVISTKDLFLERTKPVANLLAHVMFIPETKRISELIREFYRQNMKVAIVVDEYGGTSGLVTLQDILDEIFGEVSDECKGAEELIELLENGLYRISGKTPVYRVNDDCGLSIAPGDYDTLAGFLLDAFGKIPAEGETIAAAGGAFTIEKVAGRRIKSVIFKKQ